MRLQNKTENVLDLLRDVAAIELADGLVFDTQAATAETIRDGAEDDSRGVRVRLSIQCQPGG